MQSTGTGSILEFDAEKITLNLKEDQSDSDDTLSNFTLDESEITENQLTNFERAK